MPPKKEAPASAASPVLAPGDADQNAMAEKELVMCSLKNRIDRWVHRDSIALAGFFCRWLHYITVYGWDKSSEFLSGAQPGTRGPAEQFSVHSSFRPAQWRVGLKCGLNPNQMLVLSWR
jgi:hypothetical protein